MFSEEYFMKLALIEAKKAYELSEIPVGAVVVYDNLVIAKAHNLTERLNDATAHAEIQAITAAAEKLGTKYLRNCTLYVTLEPCVMCAGAIHWAQVSKLVYAAKDTKKGFSVLCKDDFFSSVEVVSGVLQDESSHLLKKFFKELREVG